MKIRAIVPMLAIAMVAGTFVASAASAGVAKTHDGLFVRVALGAGSGSAKISPPGGSLEFSGTAGDVNLAIGGSVNENLAVHATLWGWSVSDPTVDLTITGLGTGSGTANGSTVTMGAIGVGATYFFMPVNAYVSGSLGLGSLTLSDDSLGLDANSGTGFAMDLTVGKEWWAGQNFGIGLSGDVTYFSAKDSADLLDTTENWSGPGFGLRVSATFN